MDCKKLCLDGKPHIIDSAKLNDTTRIPSSTSYCPDFSDMFEETFEFWGLLKESPEKKQKVECNEVTYESVEFWDFLKSSAEEPEKLLHRLETDKEENEEFHETTHKVEFWDFLCPSVNEKQNAAKSSYEKSNSSSFSNPNDSGIYEKSIAYGSPFVHPEYLQYPNDFSGIKNITESYSKCPEINSSDSDDQFWDFLKCNPPVTDFRILEEYTDSCNTSNPAILDSFSINTSQGHSLNLSASNFSDSGWGSVGSDSTHPNTKTSHYVSDEIFEENTTEINSLKYDISHQSQQHTIKNLQSGYIQIGNRKELVKHEKFPELSSSNKKNEIVRNPSSLGGLSLKTVSKNSIESSSKSPEKINPSQSDDEFWDFLKCNSPVLDCRKVLEDYATSQNTTTPLGLKNTSLSFYSHKESPSHCPDSGRCSAESDSATYDLFTLSNEDLQRNVTEINSTNNYHINYQNPQHETSNQKYFPRQNIITGIQQLDYTPEKEPTNDTENVNAVTPASHTSQDEDSNIQLPCISSVFSINPYPEWLRESENKTQLCQSSEVAEPAQSADQPSLSNETQGSVENISQNHGMQESAQIQKTVTKKPQKRSRKNKRPLTLSPVGSSQFIVTDSTPHTLGIVSLYPEEKTEKNLDTQKKQKSLQEINVKPSENGGSFVTENNVPQFDIGQNILNRVQSLASTTVNNSVVNTTTAANSKPLYFFMPTNSENYTHFFVILNDKASNSQQLVAEKNPITSSTNNSKPVLIPPIDDQNSLEYDPKAGSGNRDQSDNSVDCQTNNLQFLSHRPCGKDMSSENTINLVSYPETSDVNKKLTSQSGMQPTSTEQNSESNNKQADNHLKNISVGYSMPKFSLLEQKISFVNAGDIDSNCRPATAIAFNQTGASLNLIQSVPRTESSFENNTGKSNNKVPIPKMKRPILKAIKNISLGKDRNAIQQTSIPVKIDTVSENSEVRTSQGNVIQYVYTTSQSALPQTNTSSEQTRTFLTRNCESRFTNSFVNTSTQLNCQFIENINADSTIKKTSYPLMDIGTIPAVGLQGDNSSNSSALQNVINTNVENLRVTGDSFNKTNNSYPLKIHVVPITETLPLNNNSSSSYSNTLLKSKTCQSTSCSNSEEPNHYVQLKVSPAQGKALHTLQELFPPPISMVPVRIMPQPQNIGQSSAPKVLILKGLGQKQTVQQTSQLNPSASQEHSKNKKSGVKPKKMGRKTVRELLQERQQSISKQMNNKFRKEIRVLRPIQKLPASTYYPTILPNISTTVSSSGINSSSNTSTLINSSQTNFSKRPNILMLPSACKTIKKNIIKEDGLCKEQSTDNNLNSSNFDTFKRDPSEPVKTANLPSWRPRHYDMSELQIGYFKVADNVDSCGRFRSKFKVLFSKRQFLYDFPVSRCNQIDLKSSHIWEQMARIVVPFITVISMDFSDRTIHLTINSLPLICLGNIHARSGIISNSTLYDTTVENDSAWGHGIRSSFHHKIVLRKRQANKLKSFLYQFDERFVTLSNSNIPENGLFCSNKISLFDGELSPTTLRKTFTKNKKSGIRRLPQWDSSISEEQGFENGEEIIHSNQMCSCRISCRSVRCSCVKAAKSCSSICLCLNCDNPLNILESIGLNLDFALQDSCLFQNIYQIPKLLKFLLREIKLSCCNTFARVQDCIPGTVLCPNIDCNVQLEFSWCRAIVCYPERNPRNHCSFCGQCCFSNGRHCLTCNRCYVVSSKFPHCPTCREKTSLDDAKDTVPKSHTLHQKAFQDNVSFTKSSSKPEIIILDAHSFPKKSQCFEDMEDESDVDGDLYIHDNGDIADVDDEKLDFD